MRGWLGLAFILFLVLPGCATQDTGAKQTVTPSSHTVVPTAVANETVPPPRINHAPTANLTAVHGNGTAALNVTFALRGSDPDGDPLNWTLEFDVPHNATAGTATAGKAVAGNATAGNATRVTGHVLPMNVTHAYPAAGHFNATLTVTDGLNVSVARLALNLTGGGIVPLSAALGDASGDSNTPVTDALDGKVHYDAAGMVAVLHVDTLYPTTAALTPVSYSFVVNGVQFDSFARYPIDNNPMTWDGSGYLPSGTSTWDTSANTVTFTFTPKILADHSLAPPFKVAFLTNEGGLLSTVPDDLMPDSGTVAMT